MHLPVGTEVHLPAGYLKRAAISLSLSLGNPQSVPPVNDRLLYRLLD